jgi:hypothetical protein
MPVIIVLEGFLCCTLSTSPHHFWLGYFFWQASKVIYALGEGVLHFRDDTHLGADTDSAVHFTSVWKSNCEERLKVLQADVHVQ